MSDVNSIEIGFEDMISKSLVSSRAVLYVNGKLQAILL